MTLNAAQFLGLGALVMAATSVSFAQETYRPFYHPSEQQLNQEPERPENRSTENWADALPKGQSNTPSRVPGLGKAGFFHPEERLLAGDADWPEGAYDEGEFSIRREADSYTLMCQLPKGDIFDFSCNSADFRSLVNDNHTKTWTHTYLNQSLTISVVSDLVTITCEGEYGETSATSISKKAFLSGGAFPLHSELAQND